MRCFCCWLLFLVLHRHETSVLAQSPLRLTPENLKSVSKSERNSKAHVQCINHAKDLPESWGYPMPEYSDKPWSSNETHEVNRAIEHGLKEMKDLLINNYRRVSRMGPDNAVEMTTDQTYYNKLKPEDHKEAKNVATKILKTVLKREYLHLSLKRKHFHCHFRKGFPNLEDAVDMLQFSYQLLPRHDPDLKFMAKFFRVYWDKCGSLRHLLSSKKDYNMYTKKSRRFWAKEAGDDKVYGIFENALEIVSILTLPDLPSSFKKTTWGYFRRAVDFFRRNRMRNWKEFRWPKKMKRNSHFCWYGFTATHLGALYSGYSRFKLHRHDIPWLYDWHRKNLYRAMEYCGMELAAEMLDNLRGYGCNEKNDRQIRDGTRKMLKYFKEAGNSWYKSRDREDKSDPRPLDWYDQLHKSWVGLIAIAPRTPVEGKGAKLSYPDIINKAVEETRKLHKNSRASK